MSFLKSHPKLSIRLFLAIVLANIIGFQVYAYFANRNNQKVAETVVKITHQQCAQTVFFYDLINKLLADSSPHFASPIGKPTVPGARTHFISEVYKLERQAASRLKAQGCDLDSNPKP